jgi:hypothetical protein
MAGRSEIIRMTDEDLYYEIPGDGAPTLAEVPDAPAPAPEPAPQAAPAARPPPPSAPPARPAAGRRRLMIALAAIGVLLLVGIVAVLSFSVAIGTSTGTTAYPYTVTYDVVLPGAEPVQIGNITLVAIPYPDRVSLSVDKVPYDIPVNQTREVSAKHATVTLLGIGLLSFDFALEARYLGMQGQDAHFELGVRTSEQIPKFLIDRLLPKSVQARPA